MSTTLKFCVQGQRITRADSVVVVADSLNYVYAEFAFCSDWDGLTKTAVFTRGQDSYEMLLDENDKCLVPWEVMQDGRAVFLVSVFAGNLITTAPVRVRMDASGWSFALESSEPPTPSVYQQIIDRMEGIETDMERATEEAASSAKLAESWAVGGTGSRSGEDTDNAQYYAERAAESATDAQNIVDGAEEAIETAGEAQIAAVQGEGTTQIGNIQTEGATQTGAIQTAGTTQVGNVNSAGSTQVAAVQAKGTEQVNAVQTKGTEVLNSIPQDYSTLSGDVNQLKTDLDEQVGDLKSALGERTKQLFNKADATVLNGFPNNNTNYNQSSETAKSFVIPVDSSNGSYVTVHRELLTSRFFLATSTVTPTTTSAVTNVVVANSNLTASIAIDSNTHYLIVYTYNSSNTPDSTKTLSEVADGIMVQYGQTYTGYEPYYVPKVADGQITESKLSNAVREKIASGEIQEIIFDKEFNLWGTSLLPVQNGKRISGYNTTTYAIETTSADGYSYAIMNIPDNIDKIKVKVSSTALTAGQAYVAVSDTLRISTNRHNSTLAASFRDKIAEYSYGDGYYTLDIAELRNQGYEKLAIGAYGSDQMYVETYQVVSPWLTCAPDIFCPIGAFGSIGAIGDSYTAGSIVKNDNTWVDVPDQAWVAVMAKRAGIEYSNYGKGGANTRSYITDKLPDVLAADANDLYFLALGINDSSLGSSYIGSISDIHDSDYTLNADTFYGNYGKIIAQIKTHAPNARFCMIKTQIYLAIGAELDVAIQAIADHYGFACIAPKDDPYFRSKTFYARVSNHPSCIGYAGMALAYERLLSKAIEKNPFYFFYSNIDANIPSVVS